MGLQPANDRSLPLRDEYELIPFTEDFLEAQLRDVRVTAIAKFRRQLRDDGRIGKNGGSNVHG